MQHICDSKRLFVVKNGYKTSKQDINLKKLSSTYKRYMLH